MIPDGLKGLIERRRFLGDTARSGRARTGSFRLGCRSAHWSRNRGSNLSY
jgi:hypothetical protein